MSSPGSATAGAARSKATRCPWTCRRFAASCRAAARSSARPAPTRWARARRPGGRSGLDRIKDNLASLGVDALVAIGGEDTLGVAGRLREQGVNVVGVPKTIDNDLSATDYTFGFDTAVNIAMEAIDRLHTTAESHHRALIVEVMGRSAGWIALHAGMAGGANVILIPEQPFDIEQVCGVGAAPVPDPVRADRGGRRGRAPQGRDRHAGRAGAGRVRPCPLRRGRADAGRPRSRSRTGKEARATVLGHVQRGGTPTAFDRVLATRFGAHAIRAVADGAFGQMVALRGTDIVRVPIAAATSELKLVPPERYAEAELFFG